MVAGRVGKRHTKTLLDVFFWVQTWQFEFCRKKRQWERPLAMTIRSSASVLWRGVNCYIIPTWASCLAYLCRWQPRPVPGVSKKSTTPTFFMFFGTIQNEHIWILRGVLPNLELRPAHRRASVMKKHRKRDMNLAIMFVCFLLLSCNKEELHVDENELMNHGWRSEISSDVSIYDSDDPEINYTRDYATYFFLGDGKGIIKSFQHYEDSYFGSGNRTTPYGFSYDLHDTSVTIHTSYGQSTTWSFHGDYLLSSSGDKLTKQNISSSDREWITEKQYACLPDDERLDFAYYVHCGVSTFWPPIKDGNVTKYPVDLIVGIEADQHAYERGVTEISATFTISGGSFSGKLPKLAVAIEKGKDCEASNLQFVSTSSKATIFMTVRLYDSIRKKYLENELSYSIPDGDY